MPSAISIKLLCNFIEITLQHGCSPVNLLHIFRTPFLKNTSGRLLLISPTLQDCVLSNSKIFFLSYYLCLLLKYSFISCICNLFKVD